MLPVRRNVNLPSWFRRPRRKRVLVPGAIGGVVAWACLAAALCVTPEITIRNDTAHTVWVTSCDGVGTLKPGESDTLHPVRPCSVFDGYHTYLGCLLLDESLIRSSGEALVSALDTSLSQRRCFKSADYSNLTRLGRWLD